MSRFTRSFSRIKGWGIPPHFLALAALAVLGLTGCFEPTAKTPTVGFNDQHGPIPNKDEVLLINGHSLSLTDYFDIRRRVGPVVSRDAVLWIGEASLLLQDEYAARGERLEPAKAVILSAYASGVFATDQVKAAGLKSVPSARALFEEIDAQLKKAEVRQNHILLTELK